MKVVEDLKKEFTDRNCAMILVEEDEHTIDEQESGNSAQDTHTLNNSSKVPLISDDKSTNTKISPSRKSWNSFLGNNLQQETINGRNKKQPAGGKNLNGNPASKNPKNPKNPSQDIAKIVKLLEKMIVIFKQMSK